MTVDKGKIPQPTRRDFISLGIGAFVVGSIPLALRGRKKLVRRTIPVMGTFGELAVVHNDEAYAQSAIDAAFQELRRVEGLLTRFQPESDVGRVNRLAFQSPQSVSAETVAVLESGRRWAEATGGAFDPCLAHVVSLWDVGRKVRPPEIEAVGKYARRGLFRSLEVDPSRDGGVVVFHDEEVGVDLGGIGKGYGVDRAVAVLRDWGIQNGLVNLGGDLYAMGESENGDPWKVGVRSPDDPDALATTLEMSDRAVATSGDYHQYFDFQGRRYHHLLDPDTGSPASTTFRSVTVAAESCMDADAGATAAFVSSVADARKAFPGVAPGAEVVYTV
jgi:thiamine biosynthesis lipoprotein